MHQIQYRHTGLKYSICNLYIVGGISDGILLEDGTYLLLEDGFYLLQESGVAGNGGNGYLDFTTIEVPVLVDDNSRLTLETTDLTFTAVPENEDCYAGWDAGVNYFNGDFSVNFTLNMSNGAGVAHRICEFSNTLDDSRALDTGVDGLAVYISTVADPTYKFQIKCEDAALASTGSVELTMGTPYFCTFSRDWDNTLATLSIYSDPDRTILVDSITCNTDRVGVSDGLVPYRYFYVFNGYNIGDGDVASGVISDMTIDPELP